MKFHLINLFNLTDMKGKKITLLILIILILLSGLNSASAQGNGIPEKPSPPRLVNDFVGLLSRQEIDQLERKLDVFSDSTSNQIAIVIVSDLSGYDREEYAQRLGEKWGVGQKGFDNGVVLLVRTSKGVPGGEVFIKTGYGLEGAIPDILCRQIVDDEIIPAFKKGEYYSGLEKSTNTIMSLASGEFTAGQYGRKSGKQLEKAAPAGVFFIILFIFIILVIAGRNNPNNIGGKKGGGNLPLWMLLALMNSGRGSHRGSWGGFSGGGGGGGFGGFGGGSFGGGGAGGSW